MLFEYDATSEKCPLPLVNLRLILKKMTATDRCVLQIADNGSKEDIPKLLTKKGYHFEKKCLAHNIIELIITHR